MPQPPKSNLRSELSQPPKSPLRPNDSTDLVLTPGGRRPRSRVHQLEPGQHVSLKGGRMRIIETASGTVVKDLGEAGKPGKNEGGRPDVGSGSLPDIPDTNYIAYALWHNGG